MTSGKSLQAKREKSPLNLIRQNFIQMQSVSEEVTKTLLEGAKGIDAAVIESIMQGNTDYLIYFLENNEWMEFLSQLIDLYEDKMVNNEKAIAIWE